ncbi:hypothetical protein GJ744_011562 [Endocarpon pusillum]|uniref:Enoyl reductase (ER) domain-containing protein n=1 Tax=Endocarpon pusillum TaxID=364733 RepID=A0A8H7AK84_9EURO|nr:hypothetical protein GJ744_011562 [Endocarpon pusillum]
MSSAPPAALRPLEARKLAPVRQELILNFKASDVAPTQLPSKGLPVGSNPPPACYVNNPVVPKHAGYVIRFACGVQTGSLLILPNLKPIFPRPLLIFFCFNMKGVIFEKAGAEPQVVDSLDKPKPSPDQILVKSIYMAINPVDSLMSSSGMLVTSWPFVVGCDAAGVVVDVGANAGSKFKVGDEVCGCTRLGTPGHSPAQEFFLMDAALTMPKPKNISLQQAATLGVGTWTAALGLYNGLKVKLPDLDDLPEEKDKDEAAKDDEAPTVEDATSKAGANESEDSHQTKAEPQKEDEWIVVLGGASSVGKYAIQLAQVAGYKVAASCSASSAELVKDLGAIPFDYKKPLDHQAKEVMSITSNKPYKIFDAAAAGHPLAMEVFKQLPDSDGEGGEKLFATTNDWSNIGDFQGGKAYAIALGPIGRAEAKELNDDIAKYAPLIVGLVEKERVLPNPYDIVGVGGLESVIEALKYQQKGAGGSNKVLAKIQDP